MGQSAGAGILELLTTLDSGATDLPFQQVILFSFLFISFSLRTFPSALHPNGLEAPGRPL